MYDWLRDHRHESPTEELVRSLIARGDRFIDLGLAQFYADEGSLRELYRRGDIGLRCAVLSNHFHALKKRLFSSLSSSPMPVTIFETGEELDSFLREAPFELFAALFMNPGLGEDDLESVFMREGSFGTLADERWHLLLLVSLRNPRLHDGPEAQAAIAAIGGKSHQDFYSAQHKAWTAFLTLPATVETAVALEEPTKTLTFSGRGSIRSMFERWVASTEETRDEAERFNILREWMSSRIAAEDSHHDFLKTHSDVYVRRGFYRSFQPREEKELNEALDKDGKEFVDAAVENPWFSRRGAPEGVRRRMYEIAQTWEGRRSEDDPSYRHIIRLRSEALVKADPVRFEDSDSLLTLAYYSD